MFIPTYEAVLRMTPTDFEKCSMQLLKEQLKNIDEYTIEHNKIIEVDDGNYQIDVYIEFEVVGVKYKTLVECKHYKNSITREKVAILKDKITSIGAHKGIIISTSNFQSGAIQYASKHGIALIQIIEAGSSYATRAEMNKIQMSARNPYNYGNPYVGVLQYTNGIGVSCSYLTRINTVLFEHLVDEKMEQE